MKNILLILTFAFSIVSIAQDKEGAEELVGQGVVLHDRGDYQGALAKYKKALTLDENNYNALIEIAVTYHAMGKYQESVSQCEKVRDLYGDSEEDLTVMYVTMGNSTDALGKSESAIEIYEEGISKYPKNHLLRFNCGITHWKLDDTDAALKRFHESALLNPRHPGTHNAIARLNYVDNKIASIMAFSRFLMLEYETARAKENFGLLHSLVFGNVTSSKKNTVVINFEGDMLPLDSTEAVPENHFGSVYFTMILSMAMDAGNKKMKEVEKYNNAISAMGNSLKDNQEKNHGFYWTYYAPYFIEMNKKGNTMGLAHVVYVSSEDKASKKLLKDNGYLVRELYDWSNEYEWPELTE